MFLVRQLSSSLKHGHYIKYCGFKTMVPNSVKCLTGPQNHQQNKYQIRSASGLQTGTLQEFISYYPGVVNEIVDKIRTDSTPEVGEHFREYLDYISQGGRKYRGITILDIFKKLATPDTMTEENLKLTCQLGWYTEFYNSVVLVFDDMVDESTVRRGKPCWYLNKNIGMNAINDSISLEQVVFPLLKRNFSHLESYNFLVDIYHEYIYYTFVGQILDFKMSKKNVSEFKMDTYLTLSELKTAYGLTYAPFAFGSIMAGYKDRTILDNAKPILLELGVLYQFQNDYEDAFGSSKATGKVSTDIEQNKCTWLAIRAMEKGTSAQKKTIKECYGKNDPNCVEKVRNIYFELKLDEFYEEYKQNVFGNIKFKYNGLLNKISPQIFEIMINSLFDRPLK